MFPQQRGQCLGSLPADNHQKPYLHRIRCDSHISGCSQTCVASVKQCPGVAGSWLREPDAPRKASQGATGRLMGGQGRRLWWALTRPAPLSCRSVPLTIARGIPTLGAAQVCQAREAQGTHHVPCPGWASSLRDHSLWQPQEEGPHREGTGPVHCSTPPSGQAGLVLLKVWLCLAMTTDDSLWGGGSHGESRSEAVVPDGPAPSVWSQLTSC